jgi:uncharacterized membrane protein YphA (DoxX/SURF4 family)
MDRKSQPVLADVGLLLIRLMLAVVFIYHGAQKLFGAFDGPGMENFTASLEKMNMPMPAVGAWAAALAEFVGGIFLCLAAACAWSFHSRPSPCSWARSRFMATRSAFRTAAWNTH